MHSFKSSGTEKFRFPSVFQQNSYKYQAALSRDTFAFSKPVVWAYWRMNQKCEPCVQQIHFSIPKVRSRKRVGGIGTIKGQQEKVGIRLMRLDKSRGVIFTNPGIAYCPDALG
jgi:hypothetical protein